MALKVTISEIEDRAKKESPIRLEQLMFEAGALWMKNLIESKKE